MIARRFHGRSEFRRLLIHRADGEGNRCGNLQSPSPGSPSMRSRHQSRSRIRYEDRGLPQSSSPRTHSILGAIHDTLSPSMAARTGGMHDFGDERSDVLAFATEEVACEFGWRCVRVESRKVALNVSIHFEKDLYKIERKRRNVEEMRWRGCDDHIH